MIAILCALSAFPLGQTATTQPTLAEERAGPFSYFLAPSDVVGFKDCPQGFQLTYDGALNNGFGEFRLLAGKDLQPIDQRVKTLYEGSYPIPEFSFQRDGAAFHVRMWALPKGLDPRENLIAYVQVKISNASTQSIDTGIGAIYGPRGSRNRAEMPCRPWYRDRFMNFGLWSQRSDRQGVSAQAGRGPWVTVETSGHVVFGYDAAQKGAVSSVVLKDPNAPGLDGRFWPKVASSITLAPGQGVIVDYAVPFVPIAQGTPLTSELGDAGLSLKKASAFWDGIYRSASDIDLPERKVTDTVKASLAYMLIARDVLEDGEHFMQTVNKFQYHDFYFRDTAFFARVYDMLGLHEIAKQTVDYYLVYDKGKPVDVKRIGEDDWGQSLWALGQHFRSTGDLEFARKVYPALLPHMRVFREQIAKDPLGLWPKTGPYDAELIDGHYTSHSFWVLLGLRDAISMAKSLGKSDSAREWQSQYDLYLSRFLARLAKMTSRTGGYIPPGMDEPAAGRDWENVTGGVYPFRVLSPEDPRVAKTIRTVREYKWREGISTWGTNAWVLQQAAKSGQYPDTGTLHDYLTYSATETMIALGMQREVLEDLYATLAHTSSTHAGFEMGAAPWGARDMAGNYPPHGWFAARTIELLRNMLVREDGDTLHLASVLSPVWVQPGQTIHARRLATDFGPVSYSIASGSRGAVVKIDANWRIAPAKLLFHVPWFLTVSWARADGKKLAVKKGVIALNPAVKRLDLAWKWNEKPDLSYARAVQLWLQKNYNPQADTDRNFLFPRPSRPALASPVRTFLGTYDMALRSRSGIGTIRFTLDGSDPTATSAKFTHPVRLTRTTQVKAVEVWPNGRMSEQMEITLRKLEFRDAVQTSDLEAGLRYQAYDWDGSLLPDFSTLTPVKEGIDPAFNLAATQPHEDNYALRFTGLIRIPHDGLYTFSTGSDDGSRLWIGDDLVVDSDGLHAYEVVSGEVALRAGLHPTTVEFFNKTGGKFLNVFLEGAGTKREPLNPSTLFHLVKHLVTRRLEPRPTAHARNPAK
jgi:hypothetical protein